MSVAASGRVPGGVIGETFPAIFVIDADGTIIGWTPFAEELFGYRAAETLHRPSAILLPGDGMAAMRTWLRRFGGEDRWSGVAEMRHRDGGKLVVHIEAARFLCSARRPGWILRPTPVAGDGVHRGSSVLEALVSHFPVAMAIWDRDLRVVWLNEAAQGLRRVFPHYRVGASLEEPLPGVDVEAARHAMRKVLTDGTPMIDREARWRAPDGSEERTLSTSLFRIEGLDGRPLGVCSLALDITNSMARDQLALIREASVRIGTTLDIIETAQELADLAVPVLADFVTVDLAEAVLADEEAAQRLLGTESGAPVFRRAGVASVREGVPESVYAIGETVFVPESSPFALALAGGRTHFEPVFDPPPGSWLDQDPARAKAVRESRMHSFIVVPLKARGDILGVTVLARHDNPAAFTPDDVVVAEELAARAALSLDNARQYTRERAAALALQHNLLPRNLQAGDALEVASHYLPSGTRDGVGGDWFDTIPLAGGRVALVVGDVTGHGINAAATMGRLRTAVRTLSYVGLPPDEVLAHLDDLVVRLSEEDAGADGLPANATGATCVYAVYDPATRRCTMAAAGHPPPAIVHPSGEVDFVRLPSGTPIGVGFGGYQSVELELAAGSVLALYTDGLIETRESDLDAGMERLGAVLGRYALSLDRLCAAVVDAMVGGRPAEDDIALLMARTRV
ncbi:protein phosphatase [Nonomuraea aridisoli]|uniref:protein-serine/threonine phosphatase n=1 Tax=Nonomuraea aridisoli TaxID=2070368 RepID=A0A2W2FBV9_9ACTN|nr:protein phosphatase [Nonomuraea aridisoli]